MKIMIKRHERNPIIEPKDVKPLNENHKVDCVFNAGVTKYLDETILLLRVAESVKVDSKGDIGILLLELIDGKYKLVTKKYNLIKDADKYDFSDSRSVWTNGTNRSRKIKYLTSLSHLRIARSKDGVNFKIDETAFLFPEGKYDAWGAEDPRITKIDNAYYVNYTGVSKYGACTMLVKTLDFVTYEKKGVIFPPENKDVSLFSEKINGMYYAYHRPVPKAIGTPDIWISSSPDLVNWGNHQHVLGVVDDGSWENGRIGGGAPSFKTDKGWVQIYHAADKENRYCLGAFLTEHDNPAKIIAKTKKPILEPLEIYETKGFFDNVIFTCGVIVENDIIKIYYGAADKVMALSEISIKELYKALGV